MSSAFNWFSEMDNSIRPNIIFGSLKIESYFEEEDMKCIRYNDENGENNNIEFLNKFKNECNFCITTENNSVLFEKKINKIKLALAKLNPSYVIIINNNTDEVSPLVEYLTKINYSFIDKKNLLQVFKHTPKSFLFPITA